MNIIPAIYTNNSFKVGNQFLVCLESIRETLNPVEGQSFDLGIRPECIFINQAAKDGLVVKVKVLEPLGRETLIRAEIVGV